MPVCYVLLVCSALGDCASFLCVTVCVSVGLCVRALLFLLFGCEPPVDCDWSKHVAAR